MNSKQRVLATLAGVEPDRVPIGEFAVDFDTVERLLGRETYLRAKAKSQIAFWEGRHAEVAESYLKDHIELHEKLDLDIVTFPAATWRIPPETDDQPPRRTSADTWEDKYGRVYRYSAASQDITCIHDPVADAQTYSGEDFASPPQPPVREERSWRILDAVVQRFKNDKFICGPSGGEVGIVLLGGLARGCRVLQRQPEVVRAATHRLLEEQNLADECLIHPDSDGVLWDQDFAYNAGPFISPTVFRKFFLAANRQRVVRLCERFGKRVLKHCCGNIRALQELFLEIGYDAYQSIQASAGMDLAALKRELGGRMTLWGGVALEHLIAGSPADVRADVRHAMACAKPGGRFILGASHSIAVGTRYENYMAMLDEYHRLCAY
ncbi:MAG TPA: uroporphyrinogen decarboxylase family protein [Phycisphaerae bacterium]|nr:uroporphyrinogen decarboxylase family protein [Phycisphaerae bacterium]HNU45084.1 uroporphyrinogen decarboxylase family protein [Phycisphaerae bacterium]